ncbi:MAG: hypothetical protein JXJ22_02840 [Bacteroidales bacterium]|nr:hypothetical protein [Bacteroidales bacterium]
MSLAQLKEQILDNVKEAQKGNIFYKKLFSGHANGRHEFLFFIKPELTIKSDVVRLPEILDLIFDKLEKFDMKISSVNILGSEYLKKYNIIAQHYGVINKISRDARKFLSPEARKKFKLLYSEDVENCNILGSIELLNVYPGITPQALDYIWQNSETQKLAGGTYAQKLSFDGEKLFLVNGFHPRQLEHFVEPGRSIVTFTLVSDISWKDARNNFIGKTNPKDAAPGSLRNEILKHQDLLGVENVSSSRNGVHLSAGPLESLVELIRYNSDFSNNSLLKIEEYKFGRTLKENFETRFLEKFLNNSEVSIQGEKVSTFDLTEELDSEEAIKKLKTVNI